MVKAFIFDAPNCPYDVLLGHNFMKLAKMKLDFAKCQTNWLRAPVLFLQKDTSATKLSSINYWSMILSMPRFPNHIQHLTHTSRRQFTVSMIQMRPPRNSYT
jgi:hypothetical protein